MLIFFLFFIFESFSHFHKSNELSSNALFSKEKCHKQRQHYIYLVSCWSSSYECLVCCWWWNLQDLLPDSHLLFELQKKHKNLLKYIASQEVKPCPIKVIDKKIISLTDVVWNANDTRILNSNQRDNKLASKWLCSTLNNKEYIGKQS